MSEQRFPCAQGMPSFWRSTLGQLDDHRTSDALPQQTDILVIGAGYSGGALLTHMLSLDESRQKSFLVLEARQLCSGATGRNGGHLKPDAYNLCSRLAEKHGVDSAAEVADFELANVDAVTEYIKKTGADCDFTLTRAVDVQLNAQHNKALKQRYDNFVAAGASAPKTVFYHEGGQAELYSGVKGAKGAFTYTAGHLWPYKLIHHMFSAALDSGRVNLQTHTAAIRIFQKPDAGDDWFVETSRGTVRARQIVVATNAYTGSVLPEYKDKIIPYRTACSRIVTPGPEKPPLLQSSYALRHNTWDFDYLVPRPDGSIIVGGARRTYLQDLEEWYGNVDDSKVVEKAKPYFDGYMQRHFRGWENSGAYTDQVWAGIMGYSSDMLPRIGHVPGRKNVFIMGGFTGHGMPQIFLGAKGLSQMVLQGAAYSEVGLPRLFEETEERFASKDNHVMELYTNLAPVAKL